MKNISRCTQYLILSIALVATTFFSAQAGEKPLSLEVARKISFDTDEGTWLSLDVSKDGKNIIFDLLGDIYALDIKGGDAKPILTGLAFEGQPVFSPDGLKIAFVSDRSGSLNLWIANSDGSQVKQITKDTGSTVISSPAWSADGHYIFVSKRPKPFDVTDIWMYHIKGGRGIEVTKGGQKAPLPANLRASATDPVASPDGYYLYYSMRRGAFGYNVKFPLWDIRRRDLYSGAEEVVITATGSAMRPVFSPDGRYLAYGTRQEGETILRLRNLDTGEDRLLIDKIQRDDQESIPHRGLLPGYSFTPDGKEIIISYGGKFNRVDLATGQSHGIPFTVKVSLDVGPSLKISQKDPTGPVKARIIQSPRQSPNGKMLAFSALGHIYHMPLEGKNNGLVTRLTKGEQLEFQPMWSPDGKWLVYVTWSVDGGHIWKVNASGRGRPVRLTKTSAFYSSPVFSPDGEMIFALRGSLFDRARNFNEAQGPMPQVQDIIKLPSRGGDSVRITSAMALGNRIFSNDPGNLHFSGPEKRLHFYAGGLLMSIDQDGGNRRQVIRIKTPNMNLLNVDDPAGDIRLSPDGQWALVQSSAQLHLVSIPHLGGDVVTIDLTASTMAHKKITHMGGDSFAWTDEGRVMTWSVGSTFYQLPLSDIDFSEQADIRKIKPVSFPVKVEILRDIPQGVLVLRGGTALTMRGDEIIENADVVIKGNRIFAVGQTGRVSIPDGAEIRDVSGHYILPGFVDTHAHWMDIRRGLFDLGSWSLPMNLAYGITSGLDVQPFTTDMFVYQDLIDAGKIKGPRAYSSGPGIFAQRRFKNQQDVESVLKQYRDHYGTRNIKAYMTGERKVRQWIVNAAKSLGMMVTTEGAMDMALDLTHAIDGFSGNEHALPVVPLYNDVVQLYAQTGIGYTPTLLVSYGGPMAEEFFFTDRNPHEDPKVNHFMPHSVLDEKTKRRMWFHDSEQIYPRLALGATQIYRAGGLIGIGSHGEFQGLGYHWEMEAMTSGGLNAHEVLQIATRMSSEIIGRGAEIGTLEVGKYADILIMEMNPLENIKNTTSLRYVMKNGRLYDDETLREVQP